MVDSDASVAWRLFHLNWIPIAAMGGVLLLAITLSSFSLEPIAFGIALAVAAFLGLAAYGYAFARADQADPKLVFSLGTISQIILVTAIVGPLSYVAGATNWPLQDHVLLAADRALGMNPESIASFVNHHAWLAICLDRGYGLIKWPLLGIPIILTLTLRLVRLQVFVLALSLALAVTIAVSAFAPAIGTYYGLHVSPTDFPDLNTSVYARYIGPARRITAASRTVQACRHRLLSELSCCIGRAVHVGIMAGPPRRRPRGRTQFADDRGNARNRRPLYGRRHRRRWARGSLDPCCKMLRGYRRRSNIGGSSWAIDICWIPAAGLRNGAAVAAQDMHGVDHHACPHKQRGPGNRGPFESTNPHRAYFKLAEIEPNLAFRVVPRPFTTAIIASEMPAAIKPYSIAVAPDSSFTKRATRVCII